MSHIADDLRRRREASWRLPPLEDGRHDPLDLAGAQNYAPATFGMDPEQLRAEAERCWRAGWQVWEIHARFDLEAAA